MSLFVNKIKFVRQIVSVNRPGPLSCFLCDRIKPAHDRLSTDERGTIDFKTLLILFLILGGGGSMGYFALTNPSLPQQPSSAITTPQLQGVTPFSPSVTQPSGSGSQQQTFPTQTTSPDRPAPQNIQQPNPLTGQGLNQANEAGQEAGTASQPFLSNIISPTTQAPTNEPSTDPFSTGPEQEPERGPGVSETITELACLTANAVASAGSSGEQYNCPSQQAQQEETQTAQAPPPPSQPAPQPREPQAVAANEVADIAPPETSPVPQTVPPARQEPEPPEESRQPATEESGVLETVTSYLLGETNQPAQTAALHTQVTNQFPVNGSYQGSLNIDGWTASCGDLPIDIIESFDYGERGPNGEGRFARHEMAQSRLNSETLRANRIILSSSAMKGKRTLTKLYQFYLKCSYKHFNSSDQERANCWVVNKGKEEGWLNEDGIKFLCRETDPTMCVSMKECYTGQEYQRTPYSYDTPQRALSPLYDQYTNRFPPAGTYAPGAFNIDGMPARCGNATIQVLSQPNANWVGTVDFDRNILKLNRSVLASYNTGSKLNVFLDECAHITYKASNFEAGCGRWAIGRANGWIDDNQVENYCFNVQQRFQGTLLESDFSSPEEACQFARACYSGNRKPVYGSTWGR